MKNNFKKSTFTLVELMIVAGISLIVFSGLITVSFQLYEINRDSIADMKLTRGSRLMRTSLIKNFKISQLIWEESNAQKKDLNYKVVLDNVDFPDLHTNQKQSLRIHLKNNKLKGKNYYKGIDKDLNLMNIDVENIEISKIEDESATELLSLKKLEIKYLLRLDYCGKSFYREDALVTPLMNFERN